MTELSQIVRQRLVELMVQIVARTIGPEFDFVLVVRAGNDPSYVLTDVPPEPVRSMRHRCPHHLDRPGRFTILVCGRWAVRPTPTDSPAAAGGMPAATA